MSFRLKDTLHKTLSESVFDELFSGRGNFYYFIGKVVDWSTPSTPPTPDESRNIEHDTRNRIINLKKIITSDVSLIIPRRNWSSGTVYDQFDLDISASNPATSGATTLKTSNFYVLSSSFQVYKVISNNNGAASTVEPSGNDLGIITTGDGYKWKFMYTIPLALRSRFLTDTFMPVQKSVLNSFYSDGQINSLTVDSKGTGYSSGVAVNLVANVHFTDASSNTSSNVPNIEPIINESSGSIDSVLISFAGLNVAGGNIIINDRAGTGSNLFPNTTITGPDGSQSTIISNKANFLPFFSDGKLKQVAILDPGKDYTRNAQTTVTVSGDGTGARIEPFVNAAGEVEDAIIVERGSGYTFAVLNVESSTGTGANLSVSFSTGDLDTSQSQVELSSVDGAIENYRVVSGGSGYNVIPSVSIVGDGTGANVTPVGNFGTDNAITSFTVNDAGTGYTFANVVITAAAGSPGTGANVVPIFSPRNGHGFDAPEELFADSLMFFSTITDEKVHGLTIDNDFRQFGILKDPEIFGTRNKFANTSGSPTFLATFNTITDGSSDVAKDVVLNLKSDTNRKFVVVQTNSSTKQLALTSLNNHSLTVSDVLVTPDSNEFTVSSINAQPSINKFSGDLLFIDNRTAVTFTDDQLLTFRTILRL